MSLHLSIQFFQKACVSFPINPRRIKRSTPTIVSKLGLRATRNRAFRAEMHDFAWLSHGNGPKSASSCPYIRENEGKTVENVTRLVPRQASKPLRHSGFGVFSCSRRIPKARKRTPKSRCRPSGPVPPGASCTAAWRRRRHDGGSQGRTGRERPIPDIVFFRQV